ncbi:FAD:protein FMN transferase [Algibacillus agarilyticus]|uniref:FAD:protein FMN transferase n=1 Tax=Algibacillus agarilyticus TaxID=2234133 RepID=UPI001E5090F0|nr:FAD:protein FMN transferase [Algibacillus agarilyticus]
MHYTFKQLNKGSFYCIQFQAMASLCEVLVETQNAELVYKIGCLAEAEAKRIEAKFSRYTNNNVCYAINNAQGKPLAIDTETASLLHFAAQCYEMSDGMFDVTSGILRRAWTFDGSNRLATQAQISTLLPLVGWQQVTLTDHTLQMPTGMEIDFGGIGKEYAVNCVAQICTQQAPDISILINFGGDIQVTQARKNKQAWQIGIEDPTFKADAKIKANAASKPLKTELAIKQINIQQGGLATSGDARRYLLHNHIRYSHILNPKTGWPITNAPHSITVATAHCIQAGCLATMALLQGEHAEAFLDAQKVKYWSYH